MEPSKPIQPKSTVEDDFWDLGDEEPKSEAEHPPWKLPVPVSTPSRSKPSKPKPEKPKPSKLKPEPVKASKTETEDAKPKISTKDKIAILGTLSLVAGLVLSMLVLFFTGAPQGKLIAFDESFPIEGDQVTLTEVETWWREPVRTGDNRDSGVVLKAQLIPTAKIVVTEQSSGTIRLFFRDGDGAPIGDTVNLSIANGAFQNSGSSEIVVHATDGFANPSEINSYANHDVDPWSLTIVETSSDSKDPLAKARISSLTKN